MNPINTVFDAKRLIGRKFQDASIQEDIKHWPFKVREKKEMEREWVSSCARRPRPLNLCLPLLTPFHSVSSLHF